MDEEYLNKFKINYFETLQRRAKEEGLHAYIYDYHSDDIRYKHHGVYFIISPAAEYEERLYQTGEYMSHLIDNKNSMSSTFFDANYRCFDITDFKGEGKDFQLVMNMMRDMDIQAVAVNAFRELGYNDYPSMLGEYSIFELQRTEYYANDKSLPETVRDRYKESYKSLVKHVYINSMQHSQLVLEPLKEAKHQKVKRDFFISNKVPTDCTTVNQTFRSYFEDAIKDYPEFYYYIDEKPSFKLKDISNKYKGPGKNIWEKEVGRTEWEVTFPLAYQEIVYTIINQFNNRKYQGQVQDRFSLGKAEDIVPITISQWDMDNWDSLAKANGIKYYINKGDVAPINRENYWDNNIILVNRNDAPMAGSITNRLMKELSNVQMVDAQIAAKNKQLVGIPDILNSPDMEKYFERKQTNFVAQVQRAAEMDRER